MNNSVEVDESVSLPCGVCKTLIDVELSAWWDEITGTYICMAHTRSCDHCSDTYNTADEELYYSASVCNNCEDDYTMCRRCDAIIHVDDSHCVADEMYCTRCTRRNFHFCSNCDSWNVEQNDCGCDIWSNEDDDDNSGSSRYLYPYEYRPQPVFFPPYDYNTRIQKTYMGFELEVETIKDVYDTVDTLHPLFNPESSKRILYFKKDGSLDNGFELVTEPMTHDYYMANFPWDEITKMRSMGIRSWNTSTCGLHVHVNRDTFDGLSHTWRFCHLFNRNPDFITTLAGRTSDRWATFNGQREKVGNILLKKDRRPERYSAVNLCPEETIEIRIFKGSLKVERVKSALDLVDGAVQYTRNLTIADVNDGALSASAFIKWLISNSDKYPSVNSYIDSYYGKSDSDE